MEATPREKRLAENEALFRVANERMAAWEEQQGYLVLQSNRPQAIAHALTDSPVAQLAWIVDELKIHGPAADPDTTRAAYDELHALEVQLRRAREHTDDDLFAASSIALAIRRCLAAVGPEELAEEEAPD